MMSTLHVLRVFVGKGDSGGNPLGVFLRGSDVPEPDRQPIAHLLGFSETVFVDGIERGELRIFTPAEEIPLAGHPLVGTSWLLRREGLEVPVLRPPAGEVPTWAEGELTWIRARPEWSPPFELRRLGSPAEVDAHPGAQSPDDNFQVWAWEDEPSGRVRVRVFPKRYGIDEDEATGSAALMLGAQLGRDLTINQGQGSLLSVRPHDDGTVSVGGRTEPVSTDEFAW